MSSSTERHCYFLMCLQAGFRCPLLFRLVPKQSRGSLHHCNPTSICRCSLPCWGEYSWQRKLQYDAQNQVRIFLEHFLNSLRIPKHWVKASVGWRSWCCAQLRLHVWARWSDGDLKSAAFMSNAAITHVCGPKLAQANFQICTSTLNWIFVVTRWQTETFEMNFAFLRKADQHIQNANPWELKQISTALVVNLCESLLLLAENLSSGVCDGSIQVLGNTLAAHERAAHHPTETHNVKCLFQNQNRRLFNRRAIMAGSLLFNLHIRNETLHFCGCW